MKFKLKKVDPLSTPKQYSIEEVVQHVTDCPFLDRRLDVFQRTLMQIASVMSDGQKVRLAELMHFEPVSEVFKPAVKVENNKTKCIFCGFYMKSPCESHQDARYCHSFD